MVTQIPHIRAAQNSGYARLSQGWSSTLCNQRQRRMVQAQPGAWR
jgi:hypothetical protein